MGSFRVEPDEQRGLDRLIDDSAGSWVLINRLGCEVIGYRITEPNSGKEIPLMYRDAQIEPPADGWKNHATVLFPIVGGLKGKRSMLGQRVISTRGNHGFARHSTFELVDTFNNERALARYRLLPNEEIRGYYPFDFSLELDFALHGNELTVTFAITNPSSHEPLYYSFGWHPGFAAPVFPGKGKKTDCRLILPKGTICKYHNNQHCRLTGETSPFKTGRRLSWTEEELEATLMYEIEDPAMRRVTFEDPAAELKVDMDFPEFPHLGFWSEPGYDFICIEPWQGMDDHEEQESFDRKVGIVRLGPGRQDRRTIRVTASIG